MVRGGVMCDAQVRLVFWKCKDVVSMDSILDQNDLFVRSWVEGCDSQVKRGFDSVGGAVSILHTIIIASTF